MIVEFNSEFGLTATAVSAAYVNKSIPELEDYVQTYDFAVPLINWIPIDNIKTRIGASTQLMYSGDCVLQFLTKAVKSNNFENTKDILIDQMILLHELFTRELRKNERRVFIMPKWEMRFKILRQYTSNYLVGIECTITFDTACNRLSN